MRAVPDASLTAASHDGYIIYENGLELDCVGHLCRNAIHGGVMALVVQAKTGKGQGNVNPCALWLGQRRQRHLQPHAGWQQ